MLDQSTGRTDVPVAPEHGDDMDSRKGKQSLLTARRRWVAAVALGGALLAAGGVGASLFVKSPAQAALESAPPPPGVMTVPVEHRVLTDSVILRGTVTAGQSVPVSPGASGESGRAVITRLPVHTGGEVLPGQVVLEVSGRPVFVLQGTLPSYRDIRPGTAGEDVKQLQQALTHLGHRVRADQPGTFGAGTKAALSSFYTAIGYTPLPASPESAAQIQASEDAVVAAQRAFEDAKAAPGDPGTQKNVSRAAEDLARARKDLATRQGQAGPMLPAAEVVYLKGFPARVSQISASVGSTSTGTALTLASGELVIHGYLQNHQKDLVRAGQKARILAESTGDEADAKVVSIGSVPTADESGQSGHEGAEEASKGQPGGYLIVVRPKRALQSSLAGQDVRITVEAGSTVNKSLVVPISAVSTRADGTTAVTVLTDTGAQRRVVVRTSTSGDGFIAVTPSAGTTLREGEQVIVGADTVGEQGGRK
ncbi:peptidoglycan-binding protein [Streptomyces sp. NPDC056480]|uniref:peptidoglycan-binding protein n=1 Tax=Streptomyces sp. NPDC056480 TaxID=3345833 RepID=UPI003687F910